MPQLPLRLPTRNELALIGAFILAALFASWLRRGQKIASLETQLAEKPRVEFIDRIVEKRVVVKGPTRIVTIQAPDGSKTTTVDRAPETVSTDKSTDVHKTETPVCPAPYQPKTRYAGFVIGGGSFGGTGIKGVRSGVNVFDSWDLGGNVVRERGGAVAVGGDITFRW